jgi:oligosaccharide repeat unit polymerase
VLPARDRDPEISFKAIALMLLWSAVAGIFLLNTERIESTNLMVHPVVAAILTGLCAYSSVKFWAGAFPNLSFILLVAYSSFHLLEILPASLGLCARQYTEEWRLSYGDAMKCYVLHVCGSGMGICVGFWLKSAPRVDAKAFATGSTSLWRAGLIFLIVGVGLLFWGVVQIGLSTLASMTYSESIQLGRTYDPRFLMTGLWAIPCSLIALLAGHQGKTQKGWAVTGSVLFFIFTNAIGYRGAGFVFSFAAFFVMVQRRVVIRKWLSIAAAVVAIFLVVPIAKELRRHKLSDLTSFALNSEEFDIWDGPRELGGPAFQNLAYSVELFPAQYDVWSGRSYLDAIRHVLPNLGSWSPREEGDIAAMRIADFQTFVLDPRTWASGGGLGSSGIAEPYVNFGFAAIPLHFFLLYVALRLIENNAQKSPKFLAECGLVIMPLCWSARDDLYSVLRNIAWSILIIRLLDWSIDKWVRTRRT